MTLIIRKSKELIKYHGLISFDDLSSTATDEAFTHLGVLIYRILSVQVHLFVHLHMFYFQVLIQWTFRAIGSLASLHWASVMSFYFVGCSSESFLAVLVICLTELDFFSFLLQFGEAGGELVSFIGEFSHLTEENNISQIESAVLVVIWEVGLWVGIVHGKLRITVC